MKNLGISLIAVAVLTALALAVSAAGWAGLLAIALPYAALAVFFLGFLYRVLLWARSPVPFPITTTCGQEKTLPWIAGNPVECPSNTAGVVARLFLEVFLFRSLFRNTGAEIAGGRPVYGSAKGLWFFGLLFHWSLLAIVLRHLRFFLEPVPAWINGLAAVDGFFEVGVPPLYCSDIALLAALSFLLLRRVVASRMRYISLVADYIPLLLILGIAIAGMLMRHGYRGDLLQVKKLALGWVGFVPAAPSGMGAILAVHLILVCALLAWFPFSKLMHMAGVFLSPTRNLPNDSRARRYVNPWNAPVNVHSYEEYENEFRDKMKAAGLPVDKEQ